MDGIKAYIIAFLGFTFLIVVSDIYSDYSKTQQYTACVQYHLPSECTK